MTPNRALVTGCSTGTGRATALELSARGWDVVVTPGPEAVATAICDALGSDDPPLRLPVGADALLVTSTRESSSCAEFEAAMRQVLQLDW